MMHSQPDQVPRAILTGGCWPTSLQTELLRASLLDGEKALHSWEKWKGEEDFENLEAGSFRLLGLLYRNLLRTGADPADPLVPRLKGIYLHFWTQNQLVLRRKGPLLKEFAARNIPFVLLKGAALTLTVYRDFGVRPMEDFDLMVPGDHVGAAMDLMEEMGWRPEVAASRDLPSSIHACSFRNSEGSCIDLHWRLCHLPASREFEQTVWQQVVKLEFQEVEIGIPSATDQFLHTCAHGPQYKTMSPVRWLADAFLLYRHSREELDWKRIFSNAPAVGAVAGVRGTLEYLHEHLEVTIPAEVLREARTIRVPIQERWENYTLSRPTPTPWHRMPVDFSHHLRCTRGRPWRKRLHGFKVYFRHANNLTPGQFTTHYKAQVLHCYWQWLDRCRQWPAWGRRWLPWYVRHFPQSLFPSESGSIRKWPAGDLSGFHLLEPYDERALRWSEPRATVQLRFPAGLRFKIELDAGSLRDWKSDLSAHLRFVFNGQAIEPSSIESRNTVLHINLPEFDEPPISGKCYPFSWVCEPLPSEEDSRALGLPVFAIRVIALPAGLLLPPA